MAKRLIQSNKGC